MKCSKINIYNLNITIKAVPCDGKTECQDGRDESFCSLEDYIEIVITLVIQWSPDLVNVNLVNFPDLVNFFRVTVLLVL